MVSKGRGNKWQMRGENHVPRIKAEQDAMEKIALNNIKSSVLPDPLTRATNRIRISLLTFSVLALVANAELPFSKILSFGTQPDDGSLSAFLGLISIGIVYFLVHFIVSVGNEYSNWRLQGNMVLLEQSGEWIRGVKEQTDRISTMIDHVNFKTESINLLDHVQRSTEIVQELTVRLRRVENYYLSSARIQMIRIIGIEIILPLIIAALALWKVASHIFPMIVIIISA